MKRSKGKITCFLSLNKTPENDQKLEKKSVVLTIDQWCFNIMVSTIIFNHGSHDMKPWRLILETQIFGSLVWPPWLHRQPRQVGQAKPRTKPMGWTPTCELVTWRKLLGSPTPPKNSRHSQRRFCEGFCCQSSWNAGIMHIYIYIDAYLNWSNTHIFLLPHQLCQFLSSSKHCN